jgi:hypothetical protein
VELLPLLQLHGQPLLPLVRRLLLLLRRLLLLLRLLPLLRPRPLPLPTLSLLMRVCWALGLSDGSLTDGRGGARRPLRCPLQQRREATARHRLSPAKQ